MNKYRVVALVGLLMVGCGFLCGWLLVSLPYLGNHPDDFSVVGLVLGGLLMVQLPGIPLVGRWLYNGRDPLEVNFANPVERKYKRGFTTWRRVGFAVLGANLARPYFLPGSWGLLVVLVVLMFAAFGVAFVMVLSQPAPLSGV